MINKEKNFVSAVIYVHNAENRIEHFLRTIMNTMEDFFEHSEIICVNDASNDDSLNVIKSLSETAKRTSISVINMSGFHGIELSMNAGVDLAIGDFVFEFDSTNLDYKPELIMDVYRRCLSGFDIVNATSDKTIRYTSRIFYDLFNRFSDASYKMTTESFRILSRRVINRIKSMNKNIPYRKVAYLTSGLKTDSIKYSPIKSLNQKEDEREKKFRFELATDSLILFTRVGYSFSIFMTGLMMLITLFMIVYSIATYLSAHPVEGWTTTILFLAVIFLGLFGILAIIIKYLQIIVGLIYKRKQYSFESIEKLTK